MWRDVCCPNGYDRTTVRSRQDPVLSQRPVLEIVFDTTALPPNSDRYDCFQQADPTTTLDDFCDSDVYLTTTSLGPSSDLLCSHGEDFHVSGVDGGDTFVMAIHGGNVESYTDQIADAYASPRGYGHFIFRGTPTASCRDGDSSFRTMHVTANNFNSRLLLEAVTGHTRAISIHGHTREASAGFSGVCVGGRSYAMRRAFIESWNANPGIYVAYHATNNFRPADDRQPVNTNYPEGCGALSGVGFDNPVNRSLAGRGLQLEMPFTLREKLANTSSPEWTRFQTALDAAAAVTP